MPVFFWLKIRREHLIELCTINGRKSERTKRNIDFRNSIGKENVNKNQRGALNDLGFDIFYFGGYFQHRHF